MKYMMGEAIKIILSASHILECFIPKFKDCLIKKDPNICLPRSTFVLQSRCLLMLYLFIVTTPTTMQRNTTSTLQLGWTRKWLCKPQNYDDLKNIYEKDLKNEGNLKDDDNHKIRDELKNVVGPKCYCNLEIKYYLNN